MADNVEQPRTDSGPKAEPAHLKFTRAHAEQYRADPDRGHDFIPPGENRIHPVCLLTTTGRKSGNAIETPLTYARDGDDVIVVASMGGAPQHPSWFLNLLANPAATVQVRHDKWQVTAHVPEGEERKRLWKIAVAVLPNYDVYQTRTERVIPVVTLKRAPPRP